MSENTRNTFSRKSPRQLYAAVKERPRGANADLTSFFFRQGANLYVFSYEKDGLKKHTFIDTGDSQYRSQILSILLQNDIDPANIERIIITHRHPDHCGLADLLARESKAKILAHPNFRSFVEGEMSEQEQRWLANFDPSQLQGHDIEYLPQPKNGEARVISGVDFPILGEPIEIGEGGKLQILTCPESDLTHSPDQIIVLYSPNSYAGAYERTREELPSIDDILFSGDLWLMRGPMSSSGVGNILRHFRYGFHSMRNVMSGVNMLRRDPREQDARAKEALKRGFSLITVKPGHGKEFIGSRIIPQSLLADRDLLIELGYSLDTDKSILAGKDMAPKTAALREQAYVRFVKELLLWRELGYGLGKISELLVRIHEEQSGGGGLVEKDRKERRERLKETLARLKNDKAESEELRQLAESTLIEIRRIL